MTPCHSAPIGPVILRNEDVAHLRCERIHERPVLEKIRDALIVSVVCPDESLALNADFLTLSG